MVRTFRLDTASRASYLPAMKELMREVLGDRYVRLLGLVLLGLDVALIAGTIVVGILKIRSPAIDYYGPWNVSSDGSFGEQFNYLQTGLLVVLLAVALVRRRQPIFAALAATFALAVADDAFLLHEWGSEAAARHLHLHPMLGLQPVDVGELIAWAAYACVIVPVLALGLVRSDTPARHAGIILVAELGLLVLFAVGCDLVQQELVDLGGYSPVIALSALVEDGGEMLAISLACATSFHFSTRPVPQSETAGTSMQ